MLPQLQEIYFVCIFGPLSHKFPLIANRFRTLTFGTSASRICCNSFCGTSKFATHGSQWYAGWCVSTVFSSCLLIILFTASLFLSVPFITSALSCACIITNPSIFFTSSTNSAIALYTNSSSSSCTAFTNEVNLVGTGYQKHAEQEQSDPEWSGVTSEWKGVDNKSEEQPWPQLVCCALICCHICGCVFQGRLNCCQEFRRGVVY